MPRASIQNSKREVVVVNCPAEFVVRGPLAAAMREMAPAFPIFKFKASETFAAARI